MRETIGQTPLEPRASGFGGTCARSFSSLTLGSAGMSDARSLGGTRGAPFGVGSLDDRVSDSDSDEPGGSSESGCDGGGSGKSSSA
eukprot:447503-Pleurochrysis_carterae.AAC.1